MADYINSNILAQSYVHVEPSWLSGVKGAEREAKLATIKNKLTSFAEERMQFFLHDDVVVTVELEDGSIKAKITAYGRILIFLNAINPALATIEKYPAYREGVNIAATDISHLAQTLNLEVLFQTQSRSKSEIIRIEARKGVFGSLERINSKINDINLVLDQKESRPGALTSKFYDLHKGILELFDFIKNEEDRALVRNYILDGVSSMKILKTRFIVKTEFDKLSLKELQDERRRIVKSIRETDR
ncbi:hypothetical protein [Pseudomonas coleopterorum]|uniref:hypothetical protein n=1 Tax=Pseudomonas coleopterorum TaxID=1605838 RepID=UPI0017841B47|nr:hypothetical protein [Pseudomonas coleopterorum]MBD8483347.1 hypothetical protein [Pseudomonas coleopterorum]